MTGTKYFDVLTETTRLLVCDDDAIMREFATVYLSSPAATVQTVDNGAAALGILEGEDFDALLLDVDMPGLSGFDVLERLRSNPSTQNLPVIMITGREDVVSIDKAFELGATSFASKPVNWRLLAYQIRFVLRTSRTVNAARQPI